MLGHPWVPFSEWRCSEGLQQCDSLPWAQKSPACSRKSCAAGTEAYRQHTRRSSSSMGKPSDGRVKRFACFLYGSLRVPAFGSAVWKGCRHMATPHPRCRGVQTSRGIALASADGARLLVSTCAPRAQGRLSWSPRLQSQAGSGAGCRLPLPTMSQSALEHREDVKCMKRFCSAPATRLAGTSAGQGVWMGHAEQGPGAVMSHGQCLPLGNACLSGWVHGSQQILAAPEILSVCLGMQVYNTSSLSILYLTS